MLFHRSKHQMVSSEDLADLVTRGEHWQLINGVGALGDTTGRLIPMDEQYYRKPIARYRGKLPMWVAINVLDDPRFMPTVLGRGDLRKTVIAAIRNAREQQSAKEPDRPPCALRELPPKPAQVADDEDLPLDDVDGPNVFERGGKLFTDSRHVAKEFGWRHDNVLQKIDGIICQSGAIPLNFRKGSYRHAKTGVQEHRLFYMDRDAFMLLVGRFEGAKALKVQMAWIAEFNRMEALLASRALPAPPLTREQRLAQALIDAQAVIGEKDQIIVQLEEAGLQKDEIIRQDTRTIDQQRMRLEAQKPAVEYHAMAMRDQSVYNRLIDIRPSLNVPMTTLTTAILTPPLKWAYRSNGSGRLVAYTTHKDYGKFFLMVQAAPYEDKDTGEWKTPERFRVTQAGEEFLKLFFKSRQIRLVS